MGCLPTIYASKSDRDLDMLHPIDPVLSTIGLRVLTGLWVLEVQYVIDTFPTGWYRCLFCSYVIFFNISADGVSCVIIYYV